MSRSHVATPTELSSLRDLELVAKTTVEGLRQGLHRSPFHGYSAEFSQYRHYRPGDDLKYVDWKAFARTDRLYTRQFRETTNLSALFVVDLSRSMAFKGKFRLAQAVTAVLSTLVIDQGDAAGLLAVHGHGPSAAARTPSTTYLPARSGHHHLTLLLAGIARLVPDASASIVEGLARAGRLLKRRGLVIAVSDFYDDAEALVETRRLSRMGHDVVIIQALAALELSLAVEGAAELVDAETGRTLVVQPDAARAAYTGRMRAWLDGFASAAGREGLDYALVTTDEPLERALRRFLVARRGAA
ncbi:MAG: DUF58 domain-containing protein [Acidobacteria bacterium]|nr:DUF58 domain-containing protein [Acidobacteriota bacterium]